MDSVWFIQMTKQLGKLTNSDKASDKYQDVYLSNNSRLDKVYNIALIFIHNVRINKMFVQQWFKIFIYNTSIMSQTESSSSVLTPNI